MGTRNTLADLNNHLFEQLERLNDEEEMLKELTEPLDLIEQHKRICERLNKVYADAVSSTTADITLGIVLSISPVIALVSPVTLDNKLTL